MTAREILEAMPAKVDKAALTDLSTCFHFKLEGEGGGEMTLAVEDGAVAFHDSFVGEPKCTVKATTDNFVKLVNGELNPMMALLTGKLKIDNQGEMLKYAKLFGLM